MDKEKLRADIISHALPLVPFEGWKQETLGKAAIEAGYKKTDAIRAFSSGAIEAIDYYLSTLNAQMLESLIHYNLDAMKIREKITTAMRIRLELQSPHREAIRKIIAIHTIPFYAHHGLHALYKTVDSIWHGIGDTSTDFNFYTKRLTLAAVYSSTLLIWLDDRSVNHEATWQFLDRRIENVMQFEKTKHRVKSWIGKRSFA